MADPTFFDTAAWGFVAVVGAGLVLAVAGGFGLVLWRRRWLMADLPTSEAAHVFVGTNEVVGRAVPVDEPLVSPFGARECCWYRALLEREEGSGNNRRWVKVSDDSSTAPFWVEDASGRVRVRPEGATVTARRQPTATHSGSPQRHSRLSVLHSLQGGGPLLGGRSSTARHRSSEWVLGVGEDVYVLGEASLRHDAVALEFAACDRPGGLAKRRVLVAHGDEQAIARRTAAAAWALLVASLLAAAAVPAALLVVRTHGRGGPAPGDPGTLDAVGGQVLVAGGLVLAALGAVFVARLFNRLVAVRERARAAWGLIDVQLRRRHDLVPTLVEVVGAAAAHERTTFTSVALHRSAALPDQALLDEATGVDRADHAAAARLLALDETHPELRSSPAFLELAAELRRTEDAVAFARGFYNDAVNVLSDRRRQFPGVLLAPLAGIPDLPRWELTPPG